MKRIVVVCVKNLSVMKLIVNVMNMEIVEFVIDRSYPYMLSGMSVVTIN